MRTFSSTAALQIALSIAIGIVATGWWLTVPGLIRSSTFVALVGFLLASAWVLKGTLESAQPASSLAQTLHDIDAAAASKRTGSRSVWY